MPAYPGRRPVLRDPGPVGRGTERPPAPSTAAAGPPSRGTRLPHRRRAGSTPVSWRPTAGGGTPGARPSAGQRAFPTSSVRCLQVVGGVRLAHRDRDPPWTLVRFPGVCGHHVVHDEHIALLPVEPA